MEREGKGSAGALCKYEGFPSGKNSVLVYFTCEGTHIAFGAFGGDTGNEDIWVVRDDGSGLHRLTNDPAYEYSPAWSPDGSRIAFARNGDVWVMHADGSGAHRLTSGPGRDGQVTWSRDDHIVFARDDRVIIMNPDGSHERRVPLREGQASYPSLRPT